MMKTAVQTVERTLRVGLILFVMMVMATTVLAQGIETTKHNLSTSGTGAIHADGVTGGTDQICVFCHTPHGADTAVAAPLWNRGNSTVTTYTVYSSPSLDATPGNPPTGSSLACLSCHDGTVAFDSLRNLPGSGGFNDPGTSAGWSFVGGTSMPPGITNIGEGTLGGTTADLSNDHPISMKFIDAKSPSATSGTNDHDTGFKNPNDAGNPAGCDAAGEWGFVDGVDCNYTNGIKITGGLVQCTSCHDPHRTTPTFLRVDTGNSASAVCLTCHRKDG